MQHARCLVFCLAISSLGFCDVSHSAGILKANHGARRAHCKHRLTKWGAPRFLEID